MDAIRLHRDLDPLKPYSDQNPAPPSALLLDSDVPIPKPTKPQELLIKVMATTVVRDMLTWPETYNQPYTILGNDFAGIVVEVNPSLEESLFKPGDEVYGMASAERAGTWAQYAIVSEEEACIKPKNLNWAEAAATPLSALTAYQALFIQAGLDAPDFSQPQTLPAATLAHDKSTSDLETNSVLISGASGSVGVYLVQIAKLAGLHVVAATRSRARNIELLTRLGADEIVEYNDLYKTPTRHFQTIIDTVGGEFLQKSWSLASPTGTIISIDSASYDFAEKRPAEAADGVKAKFFILSPSREQLEKLSAAFDAKMLQPFVAGEMPLAEAGLAYERCYDRHAVGLGRLVLKPWN